MHASRFYYEFGELCKSFSGVIADESFLKEEQEKKRRQTLVKTTSSDCTAQRLET